MTLVLDASVAIDLLLRSRRGEEVRQRLGAEGSGDLVTTGDRPARVAPDVVRDPSPPGPVAGGRPDER